MVDAVACAFFTASLSFTAPVNARHYCLLGDNRYTAPETTGVCKILNAGTGSICDTCLSLDGGNATERRCSYHKGISSQSPELVTPPLAGYDDVQCPIGYDQYTTVTSMDLECPRDSVLMLELLPTESYYDFTLSADHKVVKQWESQQCLTGRGGLQCGDYPLKLFAYDRGGHCQLGFRQGFGIEVRCGALSALQLSNFMTDSPLRKKMDCHVHNGFSCSTVTERYNQLRSGNSTVPTTSDGNNGNGIDSAKTNNNNDNNDNTSSNVTNGSFFSGGQDYCNLNSGSPFSSPIAWVVAIITTSLTLTPGLVVWGRGTHTISPTFAVGMLSEGLKNGMIMITAISADWVCLTAPSDDHSVFLPYAYFAFSTADVALSIIALVGNWGTGKLEESFDKFKWIKYHENLNRRICTVVTVVVFGGIAGFTQLALILEGTLNSSVVSTWASWTFVVSATLGGLIGGIMIILGVFNKVNLSAAWKVYKVLVGDISGLVSAGEIAAILVPGWTFEMFNDLLHVALYIPPYIQERRKKRTGRSAILTNNRQAAHR